MDEEAVLNLVTQAMEAGCPPEQIESFVNLGYCPLPWQLLFHAAARAADLPDGPVMVAAGGARGPGKTHGIFAQVALDDCQRVPGLKGLFLRQTGRAAKESFDDLVVNVLGAKVEHEYASSVLRFPNKSRIVLGGFKDEKDIDKYVGIEYDFIAGEELNQLSERKIEMLRGSLRTSKTNWRPRLYASFNPGGLGHGFVKARFVEPYRTETERDTRFIPATYRDNPYLNVEYTDYLEGLQGQLGQAWREGDFDILAGQYFTEFRERIHVTEPFPIPDGWRKYAALDYGFNAPSSLGWYAVSPEGQVFRYRELYRSGLTYSRLAEEYVSMTPTVENVEYIACDPSIWNKDGKNDEGLSGAEIFERRVKELTGKSIRLERGNNDRLAGWAVFREYLRPYKIKDQDGRERITAKLQVFDTCAEWIRTIPLQVHDERNPEDLDTDIEDHAPDETRYGLMSRPRPKKTAAEIEHAIFKRKMLLKKQGKLGMGGMGKLRFVG